MYKENILFGRSCLPFKGKPASLIYDTWYIIIFTVLSKWIVVSTAPNLTIAWWKHLSLSVWSIYIKDRWVTRWEETAISILPQEQLTTILLFWETVIVRHRPHLTSCTPHFLLHCTDELGRVSAHKTGRSISSLGSALSASQFCHWLPLFSLHTPHHHHHPDAAFLWLRSPSIIGGKTGQGFLGASGSGRANLPQTGACLPPQCSTLNLCRIHYIHCIQCKVAAF